MNEIDFDLDNPSQISGPLAPDETLKYTAVPKDFTDAGVDLDTVVEPMEYGTMNDVDAIESGYISGAKADVRHEITHAPVAAAAIPSLLVRGLMLAGVAALGWITMRTMSRSAVR